MFLTLLRQENFLHYVGATLVTGYLTQSPHLF